MLLYLNISLPELILIAVALLVIIAIGNYGRDTALGYWWSIVLCLVVSPLVAFIVILILKHNRKQAKV